MEFKSVTHKMNTPTGAVVKTLANPDFGSLFRLSLNDSIQTIEAVSRITSLIEVEKFIKSVAWQYGFEFYSDYSSVRQSNNVQQLFYLIDSETEWTNHYRSNNYYLYDPSLRFLKTRSTPYTWSIEDYQVQLKQEFYRTEQLVVSDAIDFGITQVVHFPFHQNGDSGLIRFVRFAEKPLNRFELYTFINAIYLPLCLLYEKKFSIIKCNINVDAKVDYQLSAREKEVLTLYATGTPACRIGDLLTISEHTVRNHLRNIRQKLGVRNISQAIAKAVESDLILLA